MHAFLQWACRGCESAFFGSPPWHQLCPDCLHSLAIRGLQPALGWVALPETPCPCCGKPLILVVPVAGVNTCPAVTSEVISDDG